MDHKVLTTFIHSLQLNMEEVLRNYVLGVRKYILKITDSDSLEFRRGLLTV
jgi:hypothetical protein